MKIEHIAIWTPDLERAKEFYLRYFQAKAGEKYSNPGKQFESYFLVFGEGSRLELMTKASNLNDPGDTEKNIVGYSHLAFSTGSPEEVVRLTEQLRVDGFSVVSEPRTTGDGYYESVVLDPDGNRVEITV